MEQAMPWFLCILRRLRVLPFKVIHLNTHRLLVWVFETAQDTTTTANIMVIPLTVKSLRLLGGLSMEA